jgi:hypothetical protein
VLDSLQNSCGDPSLGFYSLSASACGKGISINNAVLTELSYSGGDASSGSTPQTVNITFTSYDSYSAIKPVIFFDNITSC